jgi:hypothetical protein
MAQRINAFNKAFGNCIFVNKDNALKTITEKIEENEVFTEKPTEVKMSRIDDNHDRLSLTFSNGTLDGVVTWRKTENGKHYVLSHFKEK